MDDYHSNLKNLTQDSKSNLLELGTSLQKAEKWLEENVSIQAQERKELRECMSSLSNALEKLRQKMDSAPASNSIREIRHQIAETCGRVLQSFNQIELEYQRQIELDHLLGGFGMDEADATMEESKKPAHSILRKLLDTARRKLEEERFEECTQLLHSLLQIVPEEPEAVNLLRETERHWEDQRMAEEMAIHVDNVKREAMNLFDQEKYQECLGKFEFLCEIEPDNALYQDYLSLSRKELNRSPDLTAANMAELNNEGELSIENLDSIHFQSDLNSAANGSFFCPADVILPLKEAPGLPSVAEESDSNEFSLQSELPIHSTLPFPRISEDQSPVAIAQTPTDIKDENSPAGLRMESSSEKASDNSAVVSSGLHTPDPSRNLPEKGPEEKLIPVEDKEILPEEQRSVEEKKKQDLFYLAIAAVILILLFPAWLTWHWAKTRDKIPTPESNTPLVINTLPQGAAVFLDGKMMGNTDLTISPVSAGKHFLRLEMAGYIAEAKEFSVEPGHANRLSIQLSAIPSPVGAQENHQATAESLLEQHKYIDAFQNSTLILRDDPKNEKARQIQDQVRSHYLQTGDQALKTNKWEEARKSFETLIRLSPHEVAAENRLKYIKGKIQEQHAAAAAETARKTRIQELEEALRQALKSENYLPPQPGNALAQAQQLQSLDSTSTPAFEALRTIRQSLSTQAQQRISQRDFESARIAIAQLQTFFAGSPDISPLNALCRAEDSKQRSLLNDWLQKIGAAMSAGHFVSPTQDNVILYCNRLLAQGGAKAKAGAIKQEAFIKAVNQARSLIASEKFEDAHDVFTALQAFSPYEEGIPLPVEEIKIELMRLEFHDWPVTHDHALGSCSGKLQFNGYVISYLPRGDSKDGFHLKISEIKQTKTGERLKIESRNKTYRFQMNQIASRINTDEELNPLNQTTSTLQAGGKMNLR